MRGKRNSKVVIFWLFWLRLGFFVCIYEFQVCFQVLTLFGFVYILHSEFWRCVCVGFLAVLVCLYFCGGKNIWNMKNVSFQVLELCVELFSLRKLVFIIMSTNCWKTRIFFMVIFVSSTSNYLAIRDFNKIGGMGFSEIYPVFLFGIQILR